MNYIKYSGLALACLISFNATALSVPNGTANDQRIQEVLYNPNDVSLVKVKLGVTTLIQLEEGEFITNETAGMAFGDPMAWDVSVRGNNIFLRPIADDPSTNVTLVSNKRTYIWDIKESKSPAWLVRFVYPKPVSQKENVSFNKQSEPCKMYGDNYVNWDYELQGKASFAPYEVWDDGQFTCFKFSPSVDLPVIYRVAADGSEVLTNGRQDGMTTVVYETNPEFRIRLGDQVIGARTTNIKPKVSNNSGTTNHKVREVISDGKQ